MRKQAIWSLCVAAGSCACLWAANWPSVAGNPQRDGWAQQETHLSTANARDIKLLYKHKFADLKSMGLNALTSTIDISQVIGYTGFHEFLWTGSASGKIFQTDADLNYEFKTAVTSPGKEKVPSASPSFACPGGMTAAPVLQGLSSVSRFGGGGFRQLGLLWSIGEDGWIYTMRQQDSNNTWIPPFKLAPAGANISALNIGATNTLYATTVNGCNGTANGVYASNFTMPEVENEPEKPFKKAPSWSAPVSFLTNGDGFAGVGGTAIDPKGAMVFGTIPSGKGTVAGDYNDTVVALDGKSLDVKDYFTPSDKEPAGKTIGVTPAVFTQAGKDYVVAGDRAGRIYLLDSTALGGSDHHTPLAASDPVVTPGNGNGLFGHFATWVDAEHGNTRWVLASVHGPVSMKFPGANGAAATGGIVAFKVDFTGRPKLVPAWSSADILSPAGPAVTAGMVVALSSGMPTNLMKGSNWMSPAEIAKASKPATLYLLDATTGATIYTGTGATSFSNTPVSVANGHVYVTTNDNTLLQYGIPEER